MERHLIMPTPAQQLRPVRRQFTAVSPTRRNMGSTGDDLLFRLTPICAVDSLLDPTGTLKACLTHATRFELDFAMRAAVASGRIQDWVDELMEWPWATIPGPRGFTMPIASIKTLQQCETIEDVITTRKGCFVGYLPAEDVIRYERRIEKILTELDDLELDEIKSHVLVEHINPELRPGTPFESAATSLSARFHRLSDIAAVLAAIVLQALPSLSRLTHSLTTWSLRLAVLRQIPPFFMTLLNAEMALRTGWSAIGMSSCFLPPETPKTPVPALEILTRSEFTIMKTTISSKIAAPGKLLDFMLDQLEGLDDTLPEKWLIHVEVVEKDYSEWVAACEGKLRQADYNQIAAEHAHERTLRAPAQIYPSGSPPVPELRVPDTARQSRAFSGLATISDNSLIDAPFETERGLTSESCYLTRDSCLDMGRELVSSDDESLPPVEGSVMIRRTSNSSNMTEVAHGVADSPMRFDSSIIIESSPALPALKNARHDMDDSFNFESSPVAPPRVTRALRAKSAPSRDNIPSSSALSSSMDHTLRDEAFLGGLDITNQIKNPTKPHESLDDQFQQQISEILEHIPAKITLSAEPKKVIDLNPPDLNLPKLRNKVSRDPGLRSFSSLSSRSQTPSFTLAPAERTRVRSRTGGQQEIKVYHLSRSTGEAPIKLFIRLVGESGERVMVRVGGGWADLGEYLKEYATHHGRRSAAQIEVRGLNGRAVTPSHITSSPPSRPQSAMEYSPMTPIRVRKSRKSSVTSERPPLPRMTPAYMAPTFASENAAAATAAAFRTNRDPGEYSSGESTRSRSSSVGNSSNDGDASPAATRSRPVLGLAGPKSRQVEMTEESKQWVKQVTERVRIASGEIRAAEAGETSMAAAGVVGGNREVSGGSVTSGSGTGNGNGNSGVIGSRFGEMGKVGGTKRLFRRG